MYEVNKLGGRHIMACSVPPSAHADLPKDFAELSRIHFYLGRASIEPMIKALEEAPLEIINKGKIQIYFAAKEIQDFFRSSHTQLDVLSKNSQNPALYFQKSFDEILKHALEVTHKCFQNPNEKNNAIVLETMVGLTHEVLFLNQELSRIGVVTNVDKIDKIKADFSKIYDLKSHYEPLSDLKAFNDYALAAQQSVLQQLNTPYQFNYSELATHVYMDVGDWMSTLRLLLDEREKMEEPGYLFDKAETQALKNQFFKQLKSFNSLLSNGVINYVHSFSATLSKEIFTTTQKSIVSAETYFEREKRYHEHSLERAFLSTEYHQQELEKLNATKKEYIEQKTSDKAFYAQYLTLLYRQEKNISHTLDKIRANLTGLPLKETVTFQGDIENGFVVGTFSNHDKLLLIHKECSTDLLLNVPQAIYAVTIERNQYEALVRDSALVFNQEFKDLDFISASSFWSYGQFLNEISDPGIQKFFLGEEFDLVDQTHLDFCRKKEASSSH